MNSYDDEPSGCYLPLLLLGGLLCLLLMAVAAIVAAWRMG